MTRDTLGGYKSINQFVASKLKRFEEMTPDYGSLFELMFSEPGNIMYERSRGFEIEQITYGRCRQEIEARIPLLSAALKDLPEGSTVGLYMENSLDWIELFWCILACGYHPLLMNTRLSDEVLEEVLYDCWVHAVISAEKSFSCLTIPAETLLPPAKEDRAVQPAAPEQERKFGRFLYVMSSGTGEHVKVCGYTAEETACQIRDSYEIIRKTPRIKKHYRGQLKQLTFLPFYHIFGLTAVYIWFAFFSRTFVELKDLAPDTILNTIRRHHVTHIFAVPLFWDRVYKEAVKAIKKRGEATEKKFLKGMEIEQKIGDVPLIGPLFRQLAFRKVRNELFGSSVRFMITGGSEIRSEVMRFFNGIGYHLANGYGMSEIGITSVELSDREDRLCSCSAGLPLSSVEYRISESGELLVRGRSLARTIQEGREIVFNDPESWFHTHDLAEFRDGAYYILGRSDDVVIGLNGENLNPELIEPKLQIPGAEELCLIRKETDEGIRPVLLISAGRYASHEELTALKERAREALRREQLHTAVGEIAVTREPLLSESEFKPVRRRIAADYAAGRYEPAELRQAHQEPADTDRLTAEVIRLIAEVLNREASGISPEADFYADLGGSSLEYFTLSARFFDVFGVSLPFTGSESLLNAEDMTAFLKKSMGS